MRHIQLAFLLVLVFLYNTIMIVFDGIGKLLPRSRKRYPRLAGTGYRFRQEPLDRFPRTYASTRGEDAVEYRKDPGA